MIKFLAIAIMILAGPALAQIPCGTRESVAELLASKYGESPRARGYQTDRGIFEWWGNSETGTWTLVLHTATGQACLMASGSLFEAVEPAVPGDDT